MLAKQRDEEPPVRQPQSDLAAPRSSFQLKGRMWMITLSGAGKAGHTVQRFSWSGWLGGADNGAAPVRP